MKVYELLEYSTIPELQYDIETGFPNTTKRQHSTDTIRVSQLRIIPYVGTKSLYFKALVLNTDGGHKYDPQIFFGGGVQYDSQQTDTNVPFTASNGRTYYITPLQLTDHNVHVRCSCADFYYRFAHYDHRDNSLWGPPPPPYQRRTNTRPPVNPNRVPGMCKHILALVKSLRTAGFVE